MKIIKKVLDVNTKQFFQMYVNIVTGIIKTDLSPKEKEVLACFLSLDENIIKDDIINPLSRKMVMEELNIKPAGLTNYITSMVEQKVFKKDPITKRYSLNPFLNLKERENVKYEIIINNVDKKQ